MTPEDRKLFFEGAIKHGNLGRAFYEVACEFAGPNHEAFTIKVFYEAIRAAQAEQRRKLVHPEFARWCEGVSGPGLDWKEIGSLVKTYLEDDAILAQEE